MTARQRHVIGEPDLQAEADAKKITGVRREPFLHEMLDDPVIRAMMLRDRITREQILELTASISLALDS